MTAGTEWCTPTPDIALPDGEVHVWRVPLDAMTLSDDRASRVLSESERERASRFQFEVHRHRFIASHAALRHILATYLGALPESVVFGEGAYGKPFVDASPNAPKLSFSLSHSGRLALVAVSRERELGVDLERVRPMPELANVAARYFSTSERQAIERAAPEDRLHAFLAIWVLKEAYLKACGDGLRRRLDGFDVTTGDRERPRLLAVRDRPGDQARWLLRRLDPGADFVAALAVEGPGWRCRQWRWPV